MPPSPSVPPVEAGFSGVLVTGQGPVGVELVKSQSPEVSFEFLNLEKEQNCTAKAEAAEDVMRIAVSYDAPDGLNVNFGPDYKNVVRVHIPDAAYTTFEIESTEMVLRMQDFRAPVHVKSDRAGFWLIDTTILQGTYRIEVDSGPVYLEADAFLTDITANAENGPLTVCFNKAPVNLYLDSRNCGPAVQRPDTWPALYTVGGGFPKMVLSNYGKATIEVKDGNPSNEPTE